TGAILDEPENRRRFEREVRDFFDEHFEELPDYEVVLEEGRSDKKLAEIADRLSPDWLFVGMSGQGRIAKLVTGSTAERLAHRPPCNLAIAHPQGVAWNDKPTLMVGTDFSDHARKALSMALDLSELTGAALHIVHVVYPPGPIVMPDGLVGYAGGEFQSVATVRERAENEMELLVEERSGRLDDLEWTAEVLTGYPTRELVSYAEETDVDAMLMGTVGRSALDNFLLGSIASGVVKHMPCTVLLSPPAK
ncbi:MAG: universal stress protein, partial [Persicimonas sp.]